MEKKIDKNKLYEHMNTLVDIEHSMNSFLHVLRIADTYYETEVYNAEMLSIIGVSARQIESMRAELSNEINKLDEAIVK